MNRPARIALVTGASRGVGKGIAHELGLAGWTVFVTGRTRGQDRGPDGFGGSIDETAALVTEQGGTGIAVPCDHTVEEDVDSLAKVVRDHAGRLDLLVNNVWGGYEHINEWNFGAPLWEQDVARFDRMWQTGPRAHWLTARSVAPLMLNAQRPLIVGIGAGDNGKFLGDLRYDVAKCAVDRLHFGLDTQLRPMGVGALTIHPGFTRTEAVEALAPPEELEQTHSTRFVGRAVAALYDLEDRSRWLGSAHKAGQLGLDLGFQDIDGSQPVPFVIG